VVHIVQSVQMFPDLRALVDREAPVIVVDHAIHLYHGALGGRFLREHGTTWGFDPFFMAGYPETPLWDSSSNLSILFQWLAGGDYSPLAYKLGLLACMILALAAIAVGTLAAGLGRWEAALATLLGWLYFWIGFPIALWRSGLFSFVLASAGLVLLLGLALRFDARPTPGRWGTLTATGTALFFAHVTAPILALGAMVGYLATTPRRHGRRWSAALALGAVLVVAANLFWLTPLWRFRGIRTPAFGFLSTDTAWFLREFYLGGGVDGRVSLALLILGVAGLATWWAGGTGERARAATFTGSAVVLLVLFGFGSLWPVTRVLEPLRYRVPLHLLLAVPAASALRRGASWLARAPGGGRRGLALAWVAGLAALAATAAATPRPILLGAARDLTRRRPLVVGLRPEMRALLRWIRTRTDPSARILLEDQLRLLEATDPESVHWTPLLPLLLRPEPRQFIGGEYQAAFIAHHQMASFGDFQLGGRPIDAWTPEGLSVYCARYNIGWVICWSPLSRFCFDRFPMATRVAVLPRHGSTDLPVSTNAHEWHALLARGGLPLARRYMAEGARQYVVYRIERPHSYFLRGQGRLSGVAANRVELADVVPEGGEVVLSLHWLDTWRTDPPSTIGPVSMTGDPVPFVRIELSRPRRRIVLENGYVRNRPPGRSDRGTGA